jgi:hypothetical protein
MAKNIVSAASNPQAENKPALRAECGRYPWGHINNSSFSSQLTNGPNKLVCYIILGWKGLPGAYTLA